MENNFIQMAAHAVIVIRRLSITIYLIFLNIFIRYWCFEAYRASVAIHIYSTF